MQDEIQPTAHCRNCEAPLPEDAKYCPYCSQKNHDGRLGFREFMAEFVATLFNIDNRIFSTLRAIVVPGKLTLDYFEGKHIRYYHPLRLFLVTGAIFIGLISVRMEGTTFQWMSESYKERQQQHQQHLFYLEFDSTRQVVAKKFPSQSTRTALDSLMGKMATKYHSTNSDSIEIRTSLQDGDEKDTLKSGDGVRITADKMNSVMVAIEDVENMTPDSLLDAYHFTGFWKRLIARQQIRLQKQGDNFGLYIVSNVLWMLLIMMPLFAFVLYLMYVRRPFLYFEHLIFSFHVHSFLFICFTLVMLLGKYPGSLRQWVTRIASIIILIYIPLAMKRFYKQGWFKTVVKYLILSGLYILLSTVSVALLAAISFALF